MQVTLDINHNETYVVHQIAEHNDGIVVQRVFDDKFTIDDTIDAVTSVVSVNEVFAYHSSMTKVDLIFTLSNSSENAAVRKVEDVVGYGVVSLTEFYREL